MKAFKIITLLLALIALPAIVTAQGKEELGVSIGTTIPHQLNLKDAEGERQSFESLRGEKGLVLVFVRSADWCRYCQSQLIDLGEQALSIEELGYNLVTISYDSVEILTEFKKKYGYNYTMLSDRNSRAIKRFGILNEDLQKGTEFYGVPHPGIFIISHDKTIQAKLFEKDYKNRPPVEEIIKTIKML